jgi:GTP diphosphokinase / guanosine-3',5'-bis(diphosphate) 3'-diphosphatase
MNRVAEHGIAAHWLYKNAHNTSTEPSQNALTWVRELLELDAGGGAREFLEHVKADLFPDHVYVFTPKGKIFALPKGATALDFAYAIHSDIGNTCFAVDINDARVSLRTLLRSGDKANVHTSSTSQPNPDWLQFSKTAKARSEIRQHMRSLTHDAVKKLGKKLLGASLSSLNIGYDALTVQHWMSIVQVLNVHPSEAHDLSSSISITKEDLFVEVGLGKRPPLLVAQAISKIFNSSHGVDHSPAKQLAIAGTQGINLYYALVVMGDCTFTPTTAKPSVNRATKPPILGWI